MTREEAIRELMFAKREVIEDSFIDKAYDMAISALKAQGTCGDAVSRQTLQNELALYPIDDITSEDEAGYNRAINDVQKMVLHLPSAQPDTDRIYAELSKVYNIEGLPDEAIGIIGDLMLSLDEPSAQPERNTGKWVKVDEKPYFRKHFDRVCCSACRAEGISKWSFCPNCGAYMKGELNE